ncbi:MAG: hypothetical protein PHD29_00640 [bacterium]|nr:hypothetical protein [bacterium]
MTKKIIMVLLFIALIGGVFSYYQKNHGNKSVVQKLPADIEPAYGDSIIYGSIGEPSILNPILASDSSSFDIIDLVYNGLVKYDKDIKLVGDLAE